MLLGLLVRLLLCLLCCVTLYYLSRNLLLHPAPPCPARPPQLDKPRCRQAQAVAADMQAALRDALRDGYIFVLPTTPGPAPRADADPEDLAAYRRRCLQFASVAALSGAPSAALPLPQPGGLPLSISLLALQKRDLALLQAAVKLGPLLAEEAAVLVAAQAPGRRQRGGGGGEQQQQQWQPRAAAEAAKAAAGGGASSNGKASSRGSKAPSPEQAAAEARKEEGNASFKVGRYEEAAKQYSAAIQLYPRGAVYYNNRCGAVLACWADATVSQTKQMQRCNGRRLLRPLPAQSVGCLGCGLPRAGCAPRSRGQLLALQRVGCTLRNSPVLTHHLTGAHRTNSCPAPLQGHGLPEAGGVQRGRGGLRRRPQAGAVGKGAAAQRVGAPGAGGAGGGGGGGGGGMGQGRRHQ